MANEFVIRRGLIVDGSTTIDSNLTVSGLSAASGKVLQIGTSGLLESSGYSLNQNLNTSNSPSFAGLTVNGNVAVTGDLDVSGTINAVNKTSLDVQDLTISVAAGATTAAQSDGAGLYISGSGASLLWDNTNSRMSLNKALYINGAVTGTSFAGSGASLTSLNASNISSGTLASARLSGTYSISINGNAATATTATSATSAATATSASYASTAGTATSATSATTAATASYVAAANVAGTVANATSASRAVSAESADTAASATTATSASRAVSAASADSATSATTATNSTQLNGQAASYYLNASNINAGTISDTYLPATISSDITGNAATATSATSASRAVSAASADSATTATTAATASYVAAGNVSGTVANATSASRAVSAASADSATNSTNLNGQAASYYTNASNLSSGTVPSGRLTGTYSISISGNAATATSATSATTAATASYVAAANVSGTVANATSASRAVSAASADSATVATTATTANAVTGVLSNGAGISSLSYNGSSTGTVAVDSTVIRTTGAQTLGGVKTFTDEIKLSTNSAQATIIDKDDNASVSTSIVSVHEIPVAGVDACFFDYVIKQSTTNMRAGTLMVVTNGSTVEYTEYSTLDIGDTSGVTLSADVSAGNLRFRAVATSGTWTVRSLARTI